MQRLALAVALSLAPTFAWAGSMTLLGAGSAPLQTFQGPNWHKVLEDVPCNLISKDGQGFKLNAILIVGGDAPRTQPTLTGANEVKQIEKQCP